MIRTTQLALISSFLAGAFATPALAEAVPTLTIYTYDSFAAEWGPGPQIEAGFEKICACDIEFVAVSNSLGALRRAQLEGDATEADIILGLDTATLGMARETGMFAEHSVSLDHLELPVDWSHADFVPFDYGYFAFVYNTETVSTPPTSFEALAGNEDGLNIVIQDPRADTPGLGLVLWLKAAYGDDTNEAWPEIAPHVVTITSGWSEAYGLFLEGEADMVLSYTTSPAYHLIAEGDDRFAAAPFDEGHYLQVEVAGILKSSPQQELANQFLAYLVSAEAQAIIPTTNWMYPVAPVPLPDGYETLITPETVLLLPEAEIEAHQDEWVAEMLSAFE